MPNFPQAKKRSKYSNKKTIVDGITFDSKVESEYYKELLLQQRVGIVETFVMQHSFTLLGAHKVGDKSVRAITYKADFVVTMTDGRIKVVDVKGAETDVFKLKRKLFESQYGALTIVKKKGGRFYEF